MKKEKVVSREYKIMLQKELFAGDKPQLLKTASKFWRAVSQAVDNTVIDVDGELKKISDRRIIKFYDTDEYLLHSNHYMLRERCCIGTSEREVTLKFRHPDRYVSQDRDMEAGKSNISKSKFEEDIKRPFSVLYSFSSTQRISANEKLSKMKHAADLYPDLPDKLTGYSEEKEIKNVGHTIREVLVRGAEFQIRNKPRLDSECALIVWYNNDDGDEEKPVLAEFSFRYGRKNEDYTRNIARRAYDAFQSLQEGLESWVDLKAETKTAYIYRVGF